MILEAAYRELTGDGTTTLKTGEGHLKAIIVNAPGGGTLQVFDATSAEPPAIAGSVPFTLPAAGTTLNYDCDFYNGLTIVIDGMTSGSVTVVFE